ncbi:hypothetical protein BpHYR1_010708 [Brachionus plicatilis]|uniref:Uncharacterized protein n=1 Tax=Brachionus plicatilis TaxID=10195 RepID=A0A3M7SL04_BRAPC|nr:hypothetical protein BpHYR1_010708 [Brachionus plicatilis]
MSLLSFSWTFLSISMLGALFIRGSLASSRFCLTKSMSSFELVDLFVFVEPAVDGLADWGRLI